MNSLNWVERRKELAAARERRAVGEQRLTLPVIEEGQRARTNCHVRPRIVRETTDVDREWLARIDAINQAHAVRVSRWRFAFAAACAIGAPAWLVIVIPWALR